jgi:hypothetical protein
MAGTTLRYKPGIVTGGPGLVHDCGTSRAIGWFLEPLAVIALFGKKVWRSHSLTMPDCSQQGGSVAAGGLHPWTPQCAVSMPGQHCAS